MAIKLTNQMQRLDATKTSGIDFEARRIYIFSAVTDKLAQELTPGIFMLDETPGPIGVHISTTGGDIDAGLSLYDSIRTCKNPTTTIGRGGVYSIGAVLLQAGQKRIMTENSLLMVHDANFTMGEETLDTAALHRLNEECKLSNRRIQSILTRRSGASPQKIARWCAKETYFTAPEALKAGFIDAILGD
jgi:ATP-dependent Clp protease protease subunit